MPQSGDQRPDSQAGVVVAGLAHDSNDLLWSVDQPGLWLTWVCRRLA
jgi:hypothetical protein